MLAGDYTLRAYAAATFLTTLILTDDDGTALDLTGDTFLMHVRGQHEDEEPILVFTSANSTITLVEAEGKVILTQTFTVMQDVTARDYVYDLERTHAGVKDVVMAGKFQVLPRATR